MYGSWDIECDRQNVLSLWTAFCPLTTTPSPPSPPSPLWTPRKLKFSKNEKSTRRYYHFTNDYHKWQSYDICFFRYGVQQTKFFVILDRFLPFYPCNCLKNQNFEKMKKTSGDTIILHICTKNYDQMMYGSWDMVCDRWMNGRTESDIERWVPHLKKIAITFCYSDYRINCGSFPKINRS